MNVVRLAALVLLPAAALFAGCTPESAYFATPGLNAPTKKVPAEYEGLEKRNIAVIIWTDYSTEMADANLRGDLARYCQKALGEHIKDVTFVSQAKVHQYQLQHIRWTDTPPDELGRKFGADMVLYLTVTQYSLTQPGHLLYHQGKLSVDAALYDLKKPRYQEKVWDKVAMIAQYPSPEHASNAPSDARATRRALLTIFSADLAECFYDHEEPADE